MVRGKDFESGGQNGERLMCMVPLSREHNGDLSEAILPFLLCSRPLGPSRPADAHSLSSQASQADRNVER